MPNQDYIPNDDLGKAILFERFRDTIGTYAADLGLTAPQVAAQAADATWFRYVLNYTGVIRDSGSQWVGYKNLLLHGTGTALAPLVQTPPSPEPSATEPGIVERFRALARLIKANPVYTEPMGEALGIVGPDVTPKFPGTERPVISLRASGQQVVVLWKKDGMEAVEIQVDRGDGQWVFLAIDTRPDYIDTAPWPAAAQKWKYRAIYLADAQRIGQWSQVAEITVGS